MNSTITALLRRIKMYEKKIPYYGSKNDKNMSVTAQILPERDFDTFVDCCFGSGNVTRRIPGEMLGVHKIGIELDRGMYNLHSQIKEDVLALINMIASMENSEQEYIKNKSMLEKYIDGSEEFDRLEVAAAELMILAFSINSMRGTWRNTDFYKKHTQQEKRDKARKTIESFNNIFYEKIPLVLLDLNNCWQDLRIINGDFMDYTSFWEKAGTFCYLDLPYELKKRGVKQDSKKDAGYMIDMSQSDHEKFISEVCKKAIQGKLKADLMICTNYEIDDMTGNIIVEPDDLYINLLKQDFRMVVTERKESSEIIRKNSSQDKKKRKIKAEVVYINYKNIRGSWDNFEYYDYSDIFKNA